MARCTLDGDAKSQPSQWPIAQILRCPHAGYWAASLATAGSMRSTCGAGHGPFATSPARWRAKRPW